MKASILIVLFLALSIIASAQPANDSSVSREDFKVKLQILWPEHPSHSIDPAEGSELRPGAQSRIELVDDGPPCSLVCGHHLGVGNCPCKPAKSASSNGGAAVEPSVVEPTITTVRSAEPCTKLSTACGR